MPVVPTTGPRVGTAPLPGARVRTAAPAEAFAPAPDLSPVEHVAAQIHARAMQEADQIAVNNAEAQAGELRGQIRAQISAARGVNALGALDTARQAWTEGVAKITDGLTGDRQKQLFQMRAGPHWAELQTAAQQHAQTEMRGVDKASMESNLATAAKDAIANADDPAKIAFLRAKTLATIEDYGRREGWTPEIVASVSAEQLSALHGGVLDHLVDSGQDLAAKQYLAQHQDDLTATARVRAEKLTRASSIKGEGQRIADGITANPGLSLTEALDQVPTGDDVDPDVREYAERRVRQKYYDRATDDRQSNAQAFQQASEILEKTGDLDAIPLTIRSQLRASQNASLEHRAKQLTVNDGDPATFFRLKNMAATSPESRKAFLRENLLAYPKLNPGQLNELLNLQQRYSVYAEHHPGETTTPGTTPTPAPSPVPPAPKNPLEGLLSPAEPPAPKKKPTAAMIHDVQSFGEEYAKYLREHGYDIPADAHLVGASPAPKKK